MQREVKEKPRYAVVAAVQLPSVTDMEFEASLSELRELAKTLGFEIVRTFIQKNRGLRIDHILLSEALAGRCTAAGVERALRKLERPSDHAPVTAELAD